MANSLDEAALFCGITPDTMDLLPEDSRQVCEGWLNIAVDFQATDIGVGHD